MKQAMNVNEESTVCVHNKRPLASIFGKYPSFSPTPIDLRWSDPLNYPYTWYPLRIIFVSGNPVNCHLQTGYCALCCVNEEELQQKYLNMGHPIPNAKYLLDFQDF